jgi:hypothetical protein
MCCECSLQGLEGLPLLLVRCLSERCSVPVTRTSVVYRSEQCWCYTLRQVLLVLHAHVLQCPRWAFVAQLGALVLLFMFTHSLCVAVAVV